MRFGEWVDRGELPRFARLDPEEVAYRLDRCHDRDLIERRTIQYEGYRLTTRGYDALALHAFAERGTIDGFGSPLGVGKESDVFEVRSYRPLACKFHREGYTNFRDVDRARSYTSDREHVSDLYTARKAAEREYETLEALYPDVPVPRPVDQNRHAIVMERLDGVELARADLDAEAAAVVLDRILTAAAAAYDAGYVHADLSEHNVFVGDAVRVFDWPQAVPCDHPNAGDLLHRDVSNVVDYVRRKHPGATDADPDAVVEAIRSGTFESAAEP
jgi:RIO kinase 2